MQLQASAVIYEFGNNGNYTSLYCLMGPGHGDIEAIHIMGNEGSLYTAVTSRDANAPYFCDTERIWTMECHYVSYVWAG